MTWLDLYNFLHNKANNIKELDSDSWGKTVFVHNAETGEEVSCDVWSITDDNNKPRLVLAINEESLHNQVDKHLIIKQNILIGQFVFELSGRFEYINIATT